MAEVYSVTTATLAVSASATKCWCAVISSSTQTARLVQAAMSFDGSVPATGWAIEFVRYTTDGTGTAYTPLKYNGEAQNRVAMLTAKVNYTADPTTPTVVESYFVSNTGGQFWQMPLGRELYVPVSTIFGMRLVTPSGAAGNARATMIFEE